MHDASGKLPSGILQGNVHQLGDFDECLDVKLPDENFQGRYCLANVQVTIPKNLEFLKTLKEEKVLIEMFSSSFKDVSGSSEALTVKFNSINFQSMFIVPRSSEIHWAFCVPSACSPQEVEISIKQTLTKVFNETEINFEVEVNDNQCCVKDQRNLEFATTFCM